jgi:gamma-glutamylcyclotransferase (GGCT)/AIG2-like uncharacterized protein YtfP
LSPDHLFVYGTLRRGSNNQFARLLIDQARFVGAARVRGRLYDFGPYPGAKPSDEYLHGEVFRLSQSSNLLAELDDYEGPEFERATLSALLNDGGTIDCWIYWYVGPAQGRVIASGDWFQR